GEHIGEGQVVASAPPGTAPMAASPALARAADRDHTAHAWGPFAPTPLAEHLPITGDVTYRYGPDSVSVETGRFATDQTNVSFGGRTSWGDQSSFHFHVTSSDWQESDEVLAGILTDFGSRTSPVSFGGRGEFDGDMTGPIRRPRVEGVFTGEDLRAWDTV